MFNETMWVLPTSLGVTEENPLLITLGINVLIAVLEDNIEATEHWLVQSPQATGIVREVVSDKLSRLRDVLARLNTIDQTAQPNLFSSVYWAPDTDEFAAPDNGFVQ